MQWAPIVQSNRRWDVVGFSPLFQALIYIDRANNRFIAFDRSSPEAKWSHMFPSSPNSILTVGTGPDGRTFLCDVDLPKLIELATRKGSLYLPWQSFGPNGPSDLASALVTLPESIWQEAEVQP